MKNRELPCKNCLVFPRCFSKYHTDSNLRVWDILITCYTVTQINIGKYWDSNITWEKLKARSDTVAGFMEEASVLFNSTKKRKSREESDGAIF